MDTPGSAVLQIPVILYADSIKRCRGGHWPSAKAFLPVGGIAHDTRKAFPFGEGGFKMFLRNIFEAGRGSHLSHRKRFPVNQSMIVPDNHRDSDSLRYPTGEGISLSHPSTNCHYPGSCTVGEGHRPSHSGTDTLRFPLGEAVTVKAVTEEECGQKSWGFGGFSDFITGN